MIVEKFVPACEDLGIHIAESQLSQFEAFEDALYRANETVNLTRVPREECWRRHFLDSLLVHDLIPQGESVLDIGSGPGFPAWPLACARPDLHVVALDSSSKMADFLNSATLPNLRVVISRAEEWKAGGKFDVVTGRALAPLAVQIEISAHLCAVGGLILPMRTPLDAIQFQNIGASKLGLKLEEIYKRLLPGNDATRLIPAYRKVEATPNGYPRRWAEIRRSPLSGL